MLHPPFSISDFRYIAISDQLNRLKGLGQVGQRGSKYAIIGTYINRSEQNDDLMKIPFKLMKCEFD